MRVAFPVGIVLLSCFSMLSRLTQEHLSRHLAREARKRDAQAMERNAREERRLRRTAEAALEAAGIESIPSPEATARRQLARLHALLDVDFYALLDKDGTTAWSLRRDGEQLRFSQGLAWVRAGAGIGDVDGRYYFLTAHPLAGAAPADQTLVIGRSWRRDLLAAEGGFILAAKGRVVEVSDSLAGAGWAEGMALPECNGGTECQAETAKGRFALLRSALSRPPDSAALYLVQPLDALAGPLPGMTQVLMAAGVVLSLLGALGLALLVERGIANPLREITHSCLRAQATQQLADIQIVPSRIAEVHTLGQTLKAAIRTIDEGQTQLTQAYFQFMGAIVALLDARDTYTAGHSHRVSAYAETLARDFGLPRQQVDDIRVAALLHDIGKIGVPDEVLRKHERLTKQEFDLMKQHPAIGRKVLEQIVQFEKYLDAVELHHENLDGTGYPRGLRGEAIPIAARIVKVADVYDALSTDRPYRKKLRRDQVYAILRNGSGVHFDRLLVEIFLTRSVPRFERHSDLGQLHAAVGESRAPLGPKSPSTV